MINTKYSRNVAEALLATALFAVIDVCAFIAKSIFPDPDPTILSSPALMITVVAIAGTFVIFLKGIKKISGFKSARFEQNGFLMFILANVIINIAYTSIFNQSRFPIVADIGTNIILSLYMFDILYAKILKRGDDYYNGTR